MKNFILIAIFSVLTFSAFGQFSDDCAGVTIDNVASASIPYSVTGDIPDTYTDDGSYDATNSFPTDPYTTCFYAFTVEDDGYYNIHFDISNGGTASGTLSVGWDPTVNACPSPATETDNGDITDGFDITSDCVNLTSGTTYYISMALENGHEGTFTITIDKGEDVCEGALESMIEGTNPVNNMCSQDGTIWTTYTVVSEGNDHISVDISTEDGDLEDVFVQLTKH